MVKLVDINEIYHEMSSPTPFDKISHKVNTFFFLHSIYINNMLHIIKHVFNYYLELMESGL
jgi:hypothetical protein